MRTACRFLGRVAAKFVMCCIVMAVIHPLLDPSYADRPWSYWREIGMILLILSLFVTVFDDWWRCRRPDSHRRGPPPPHST